MDLSAFVSCAGSVSCVIRLQFFTAGGDFDAAGLGELVVPVYAHVPDNGFADTWCHARSCGSGYGSGRKRERGSIISGPFYSDGAGMPISYSQVIENLQILGSFDLVGRYIGNDRRNVDIRLRRQ